ncbi:MAG: hypothetical protein CFE28_01430 [Alphaproteobacteria bacterium PA2]|nr:MAG: hypothetical protein CFE28_01430 [Alphaproteobacteria bacterium PA2]
MTTDNDSPKGDPFARVAKAAAGQSPVAAKAKDRDKGDHLAPAPDDAPELPAQWKGLGAHAKAWCYRDSAGRVLRWVLRFEKTTGGEVEKDIRPATLWRDAAGKLAWRLASEPGSLRPLYGLDKLASRIGAPVLLVEGEKAADAAGERFPEFLAMTWPGGSNAVGKADFGPLTGRHVLVWPDADEPGRKAAQAAARAALSAGALSAAVVELPGYLPKGWDLADEWLSAFTHADAAALISETREAAQPGGVVWPWAFRMDGGGLWFDAPAQGGGKPVPSKIAGPFEVVGEARDPEGDGWAIVIKFRDRDGREKMLPIAKSRLASGGADVRAELAGAGLMVSPARGKSDKFCIALMEVEASCRLVLVSATGWTTGERFVLPSQTIGLGRGEDVIFTGEAGALHYRRSGSLDGWRSAVAAFAPGNDLLTVATSLAFLGPLLRPLGLDGGGLHINGGSSSGKTTLILAAGSVWGGGGEVGFGATWRQTSNAAEMVAFGHNDGLLILDELQLLTPDEAGPAAYSLASGQSKARSKADGSLRRRAEWRVAILSTGEVSLSTHIRSGSRNSKPMAGQELRLLDIAADAGQKMGIWEDLHGLAGPAALSDAIKAASGKHYGHAGPAFVEAFIAKREDSLRAAKAFIDEFERTVRRDGDTGQVQRAAKRFAAIAAAGELATSFGLTGWPKSQAFEASARLYHRWAAAFGRDQSYEVRAVLRKVKAVIESEGASFAPWDDFEAEASIEPSRAGRDEQARGLKSWGYRVKVAGVLEFRFNDAGFEYATQGFGQKAAAAALHEAGHFERGDGDHWKKKHKRKGVSSRYWTVKGSILEADLGD